jgi:hypothetical protein
MFALMNTVYAYLRALLWHVEKLKTQGIQTEF